jgi:hypothetical protein
MTWWSATDELWYEIQGTANGVRCLACFTNECWEKGVSLYWRPVVDARKTTDGRWVSMDELFSERTTSEIASLTNVHRSWDFDPRKSGRRAVDRHGEALRRLGDA